MDIEANLASTIQRAAQRIASEHRGAHAEEAIAEAADDICLRHMPGWYDFCKRAVQYALRLAAEGTASSVAGNIGAAQLISLPPDEMDETSEPDAEPASWSPQIFNMEEPPQIFDMDGGTDSEPEREPRVWGTWHSDSESSDELPLMSSAASSGRSLRRMSQIEMARIKRRSLSPEERSTG